MSNTNSSNKAAVPEAKGALNRFKFEVASGARRAAQRWLQRKSDFQTKRSVGGYMVKKMIEAQERQMSSGSQNGQMLKSTL